MQLKALVCVCVFELCIQLISVHGGETELRITYHTYKKTAQLKKLEQFKYRHRCEAALPKHKRENDKKAALTK